MMFSSIPSQSIAGSHRQAAPQLYREAQVEDLEILFNQRFRITEGTLLKSGADEPLYAPARGAEKYHCIYSTRDYFSSALHEISHWCIAGRERRLLLDYGYWYEADGRSPAQQRAFEQVEIKPQALEWIFTEACGQVFRLSSDNIENPEVGISQRFREDVCEQAHRYLSQGLPSRAGLFLRDLLRLYRGAETMPADWPAVFRTDVL